MTNPGTVVPASEDLMSNIYGDQHRELQQHFDTTQLADRLEQMIVKTALDAPDQALSLAAICSSCRPSII